MTKEQQAAMDEMTRSLNNLIAALNVKRVKLSPYLAAQAAKALEMGKQHASERWINQM